MAETTKTLDRDDFARGNVQLAHAVEDGHASAEERRDFSWVDVLGNSHSSFSPERGVFAVPAVAHDAVDGLVVAHLEVSPVAGLAGEVVAAVPGPADAVADFPFLFGFGGVDDGADEFVAETLDCAVWKVRL